MRVRDMVLTVVGTVALAGCSSGSDAAFTCSRYIDVIDDFEAGEMTDFQAFKDRLASIGDFKEGSGLAQSFDRLQAAFDEGDETRAVDETNFLYDQCVDVAG